MGIEIGVLKGDGIGPEITLSAVDVLAATDLTIEFIDLPVGLDAYDQYGSSVPEITQNRLESVDGWILGPVFLENHPNDDPADGNPSSYLRQKFDLYANCRPIQSYEGIGPQNMDVTIFRQNTEGFLADRNMYLGDGRFMPTENTALSVRVVTREESRRIADVAFFYAAKHDKSVTAVHKSNVLKNGGKLFIDAVKEVAKSYPNVELETQLVDSFAMDLVVNPTDHGVIVTTNLFGDILSDEAAGIVGSLGLAPGLNYNDDDGYAMAQATHGAALEIAGEGIANPTSMILSGALLLEWLGENQETDPATAATNIRAAITQTINEGYHTPDLGGDTTTEQFTNAVINHLTQPPPDPER